jgi:hypothetical protein
MDLTARKKKFIERFKQITNVEKLKRLEDLLQSEMQEDTVAYTVSGEPLSKTDYIKRVKNANKAIDDGHFTTAEDLEKEIKGW